MKTWMTTDAGPMPAATVRCGIPPTFPRAGRRTGSVIGRGSPRGDGPGSMMPPGDSLLSTTDGGVRSAETGPGFPGRLRFIRSMLPRWLLLWVGELDSIYLHSAEVLEWRGFRLVREKYLSLAIT